MIAGHVLARSLALFLGLFSVLNLVGELARPGFDATLWWVDLRWLPVWLSRGFLWLTSFSMLLFAFGIPMNQRGRLLSAALLGLLALLALLNVVVFYWLLFRGEIKALIPVPISLLIFASLAFLSFWIWRSPEAKCSWIWIVLAFGFFLVAAPALQMFLFGTTDYKRPADAILVFGARAYANGTPSDALSDRINAACRLYQEGLAPKMILSGGPGDGALSEPEVMKRIALECGVPEDRIFLDAQGLNTQATVENTQRLLTQLGVQKVIAVSHFYHLPRIKMAFQRQGLEVYTSAAPQQRVLLGLPYFMLREVAGIWAYYFMIRG